jgi:hypothetical protein
MKKSSSAYQMYRAVVSLIISPLFCGDLNLLGSQLRAMIERIVSTGEREREIDK